MRLIESEIKELKLKILDMAELVRVQLDQCTLALNTLDRALADRILKREDEVDDYDTKIAIRCERVIALYQPVANDLRFVFTALRINDFLEQVGDQISGIAHKILKIEKGYPQPLLDELQLQPMQHATREILQKSLRAYFYEDAAVCKGLFAEDDVIDDIHRAAFGIVIRYVQEDPGRAADYLHLLHCMRNLEKIGDYAVMIAEESIFHIEGIMYRHTELKYNPRARQVAIGSEAERVSD